MAPCDANEIIAKLRAENAALLKHIANQEGDCLPYCNACRAGLFDPAGVGITDPQIMAVDANGKPVYELTPLPTPTIEQRLEALERRLAAVETMARYPNMGQFA